MSLNDLSLRTQGSDTYPGVANPTSSSNNSDPVKTNYVDDPTSEERGAGAGPNFDGDQQAQRNFKQTAGVVEGRPGIIESANIDPLNEGSNKDDGWANASKTTPSQKPGLGAATSQAAEKIKEILGGPGQK